MMKFWITLTMVIAQTLAHPLVKEDGDIDLAKMFVFN